MILYAVNEYIVNKQNELLDYKNNLLLSYPSYLFDYDKKSIEDTNNVQFTELQSLEKENKQNVNEIIKKYDEIYIATDNIDVIYFFKNKNIC